MARRTSKEHLKSARAVTLIVAVCFTGFICLIYVTNLEDTTPKPQIKFLHNLETTVDGQENIKAVELKSQNRKTTDTNVNLKQYGNWPDAEEELGIAYPLMVAGEKGKRWNPDWVYRGNPVHPLPDYKSNCWEERFIEEDFKIAYKRNGFVVDDDSLRTSMPRFMRPVSTI